MYNNTLQNNKQINKTKLALSILILLAFAISMVLTVTNGQKTYAAPVAKPDMTIKANDKGGIEATGVQIDGEDHMSAHLIIYYREGLHSLVRNDSIFTFWRVYETSSNLKSTTILSYSTLISRLTAAKEYTLYVNAYQVDSRGDKIAIQYSNVIHFTVPTIVEMPVDPVKEHHDFVGWYMDAALTIPYAGEPIYDNTNLYAKFIPKKYTVFFDSLGGSDVASITQEYNTTITAPAEPTRVGYRFIGWYTDEACTVEYDYSGLTGDITLYAKWELQTRIVTFYVDGEIYITLDVPYGGFLGSVTEAQGALAAMGDLYTDEQKKTSSI